MQWCGKRVAMTDSCNFCPHGSGALWPEVAAVRLWKWWSQHWSMMANLALLGAATSKSGPSIEHKNWDNDHAHWEGLAGASPGVPAAGWAWPAPGWLVHSGGNQCSGRPWQSPKSKVHIPYRWEEYGTLACGVRWSITARDEAEMGLLCGLV